VLSSPTWYHLVRADIPWNDSETAFLVSDIQPSSSSKDALPLNNLPTDIVTDASGKKELRLYHPTDAFEKNLCAYISSVLPFLKCRYDSLGKFFGKLGPKKCEWLIRESCKI